MTAGGAEPRTQNLGSTLKNAAGGTMKRGAILKGPTELDFTGQKCSTFPVHALVPSVRVLTLTAAGLADVPLDLAAYMVNLEEVYLGGNSLQDASLPPLLALPKVKHIGLAYNRIAALPPPEELAGCGAVSLDLSHNDLCDMNATVAALAKMPRLRSLSLKGNPLGVLPGYKAFICGWLPALTFLDGLSLRPEPAAPADEAAPETAADAAPPPPSADESSVGKKKKGAKEAEEAAKAPEKPKAAPEAAAPLAQTSRVSLGAPAEGPPAAMTLPGTVVVEFQLIEFKQEKAGAGRRASVTRRPSMPGSQAEPSAVAAAPSAAAGKLPSAQESTTSLPPGAPAPGPTSEASAQAALGPSPADIHPTELVLSLGFNGETDPLRMSVIVIKPDHIAALQAAAANAAVEAAAANARRGKGPAPVAPPGPAPPIPGAVVAMLPYNMATRNLLRDGIPLTLIHDPAGAVPLAPPPPPPPPPGSKEKPVTMTPMPPNKEPSSMTMEPRIVAQGLVKVAGAFDGSEVREGEVEVTPAGTKIIPPLKVVEPPASELHALQPMLDDRGVYQWVPPTTGAAPIRLKLRVTIKEVKAPEQLEEEEAPSEEQAAAAAALAAASPPPEAGTPGK